MKKIAVIGSRKFSDLQAVALKVNSLFEENGRFMLISGGADGVCKMAEATAHEFGFPVISFRAAQMGDEFIAEEWRLHRGRGKLIQHTEPTWADYTSALIFRSLLLIERADEVVAFHNGWSGGTAYEVALARDKDKPLELIIK